MKVEIFKNEDFTEYNRQKAGECAHCGSTELEYGSNVIDGDEVHFYFVCQNCGGAGCETYTMEYTNTSVIINN